MSQEHEEKGHLLPEVDEENIEDWDYCIIPPTPKKSRTITVKAKYMGRAKPKLYYLEDDE